MSRVLVVEDSASQAEMIQSYLTDEGYAVELARNGQEGLKALEQKIPDIVVTDLQMPELDGLQLVETVRKQYPRVPIILMTAHGSEDIAIQALQKGAATYAPQRKLARDVAS